MDAHSRSPSSTSAGVHSFRRTPPHEVSLVFQRGEQAIHRPDALSTPSDMASVMEEKERKGMNWSGAATVELNEIPKGGTRIFRLL